MRARRLISVLGALSLVLAAPSAALADGDPASDFLLTRDTFTPYYPAPGKAALQGLQDVTAAARKAGYPIKVAVIAGPGDLGAYPDLFGKPEQYAKLLESEISFNSHPRLIVVMPAGVATQNLPATADAALQQLQPGKSSDELTRTAVQAVAKAATAAGHPVKAPALTSGGTSSSGSGGGTNPAVFAAPLLLVLLGGGVVALRNRRRPPEEGAAALDDPAEP